MASSGQEAQATVRQEETPPPQQNPESQVQQEQYAVVEETPEQQEGEKTLKSRLNNGGDRPSFVHGLAVGLGIGCISTFVIMWIAVFFSPQLPSTVTYEAMLAVFIYPLIYLLAVGLVALTAGIVREYYTIRDKL
jgi:hypothetical protein